jgi:dihydrodipicolinate synthase/N-acetylneuraminate lyase
MPSPVLDGIITVLITPFGADGAIDFVVLGGHIDFFLEKGVRSILERGSTGEYAVREIRHGARRNSGGRNAGAAAGAEP